MNGPWSGPDYSSSKEEAQKLADMINAFWARFGRTDIEVEVTSTQVKNESRLWSAFVRTPIGWAPRLFLLAALAAVPALAHDDAAENAKWFNSLTNKQGGSCCGQESKDPHAWDCQELDNEHIRAASGGGAEYRQDAALWRFGDGKWHIIPEQTWGQPKEFNPTPNYVVCVHWFPTSFAGGGVKPGDGQVLCAFKPAGT